MIKIHQKYIFNQYITFLFGGIFSLVLITTLMNAAFGIANMTEGDGELNFEIYIFKLLYDSSFVFGQTAQLGSLFASVMLLIYLETSNEIIALFSLKISLWQIMKPMFLGGLVLIIMLYFNQSYLTPLFLEKSAGTENSKDLVTLWHKNEEKLSQVKVIQSFIVKVDKAKVYYFSDKAEIEKIVNIASPKLDDDGKIIDFIPKKQLSISENNIEEADAKDFDLPELNFEGRNLENATLTQIYKEFRALNEKDRPLGYFWESLSKRLALFLSIPTLIFIAFPLSFSGARSAKFNRGVIVCIIVSYLFYTSNQVFNALSVGKLINPILANFSTILLCLALSFFLIFREKIASLFARSRKITRETSPIEA